jgi:carbon storage regulator
VHRSVHNVGRPLAVGGELICMLVLTRKPRQSIVIGDDIEVTVLAVQGEKVRLGIEAPTDVPVFRTEIYLEIEQGRGRRGQRRGVSPEVEDAPGARDRSDEQG